MSTQLVLNDPYTLAFAASTLTVSWPSGARPDVRFDTTNLDYQSNTAEPTLLALHSVEDWTTLRSTVCTNGPFATAALLQAYINTNIIPPASGTITSISAGQGITLTPNPIIATGTVAVSNLGITTGMIAANAVTLPKLATQAANTVLGNATGGAATPTALTAGTGISIAASSISVANTGVTPGVYVSPTITVDSTGRVTDIESNAVGSTLDTNTVAVDVTGSSSYQSVLQTEITVPASLMDDAGKQVKVEVSGLGQGTQSFGFQIVLNDGNIYGPINIVDSGNGDARCTIGDDFRWTVEFTITKLAPSDGFLLIGSMRASYFYATVPYVCETGFFRYAVLDFTSGITIDLQFQSPGGTDVSSYAVYAEAR